MEITKSKRNSNGKRKWDMVVFDWDGTMMATVGLIVEGFQHACKALDLPVPTSETVRPTIGMNWKEAMPITCPACRPEQFDDFLEAYKDWYIDREGKIELVPGMRELLVGLKKEGFAIGLATGKGRIGVERVFDRFDLWELFDEVQTSDKTVSKPNPEMLKRLSRSTDIPCTSMVMVGDCDMDLIMAKNAGASSIGVTYGASSIADLRKENPVAICSCAGELAEALGVKDKVQLPAEAFRPLIYDT